MAESIWGKGFVDDADTPGLALRTTNGAGAVELLMEKWAAGTSEGPHSHPGGDMTIVVEGLMHVQFYKRLDDGSLEKDGDTVVLKKGETGYIAGNRIHDAKYVEDCRLVYIHDGPFGFKEEK